MALDASYAHHDVMGARHDAPGARHGTCRVHPGRDGLIPSDARLRREKERRVPPLRPQLARKALTGRPIRGGAVLCGSAICDCVLARSIGRGQLVRGISERGFFEQSVEAAEGRYNGSRVTRFARPTRGCRAPGVLRKARAARPMGFTVERLAYPRFCPKPSVRQQRPSVRQQRLDVLMSSCSLSPGRTHGGTCGWRLGMPLPDEREMPCVLKRPPTAC